MLATWHFHIEISSKCTLRCLRCAKQKESVLDIQQVQKTWKTNDPHPTCAKVCSTDKNQTPFEDQWQREVCLNV